MPKPTESGLDAYAEVSRAARDFQERLPDLKPREVAIIGIALAETALRRLLEGRFVQDSDKLFDKGALVSFEARAKLARALGCLPTTILSELLVLAQIRNRFAHRYNVQDFEDEDVGRLVDELRLVNIGNIKSYFEEKIGLSDGGSLPGYDGRFVITDARGYALMDLYIDVSGKDRRARFENSLKITWAAIEYAIYAQPR